MKHLPLALTFVLSGCSVLTPPISDYKPFAVDVQSLPIYNTDLAACLIQSKVYHSTFDWKGVGSAGINGAAANAAGAAVNPAVPVIGAAGEAGSAAWRSMDLTGAKERYVIKKCMERRGERSGAYTIADPD